MEDFILFYFILVLLWFQNIVHQATNSHSIRIQRHSASNSYKNWTKVHNSLYSSSTWVTLSQSECQNPEALCPMEIQSSVKISIEMLDCWQSLIQQSYLRTWMFVSKFRCGSGIFTFYENVKYFAVLWSKCLFNSPYYITSGDLEWFGGRVIFSTFVFKGPYFHLSLNWYIMSLFLSLLRVVKDNGKGDGISKYWVCLTLELSPFRPLLNPVPNIF